MTPLVDTASGVDVEMELSASMAPFRDVVVLGLAT